MNAKEKRINEITEMLEKEGTSQITTTPEQIEAMKLNQLRRIAASLEKISDSVELLEKLADCVDEIPQYGSRLSIGGTVSADVR